MSTRSRISFKSKQILADERLLQVTKQLFAPWIWRSYVFTDFHHELCKVLWKISLDLDSKKSNTVYFFHNLYKKLRESNNLSVVELKNEKNHSLLQ